MRIKFFIALTIVVVLSFSCQQELDVEPTIVHPPKILSVEPNPAKPGDVITITGQNFSARYWESTLAVGSERMWIDSGTTSKLFARVPWGISSGILFYKTQTDTVVGPSLSITSACSTLICFSSYVGIPVTDSSSWVRDFFGRINKWSITISADTITLKQLYTGGDDAYTEKILRFKHLGNTSLPLYLDGIWEVYDFPLIRTHEPIKGYIAVERWSIPGILSGRVSTYVDYYHDWEDFNFYYEVK